MTVVNILKWFEWCHLCKGKSGWGNTEAWKSSDGSIKKWM